MTGCISAEAVEQALAIALNLHYLCSGIEIDESLRKTDIETI